MHIGNSIPALRTASRIARPYFCQISIIISIQHVLFCSLRYVVTVRRPVSQFMISRDTSTYVCAKFVVLYFSSVLSFSHFDVTQLHTVIIAVASFAWSVSLSGGITALLTSSNRVLK